MAGQVGAAVQHGLMLVGTEEMGTGPAGASAAGSVPGGAVGARPVAVQSVVRCERIVELDRSIAALTAERAALLVAERDCGQWKRAGYASFEAWRSQMSGEGLRTARAQVAVAAVLEESPDAAEAVVSGQVTVVHAEILGKVRSRAERPGSLELTADESQELLDLAKKEGADAFAKTADRWWARRDSVAHDASHEEIRRRRFLSISHTAQGTHIKGFVDVVDGQRVQVALEAAMSRPPDGDDRDYAQRMADALVDVADRAVNGGSLKNGALVRPHVSVILTEETFVQARHELRRRAAAATAGAGAGAAGTASTGGRANRARTASTAGTAGTAPASASASATIGDAGPDRALPGLATGLPQPVTPATFEDGTPVPLSEVARILCDAELTRIVMSADDVPINLGRTVRLYTREQRRAIIVRDRGCQFHGCTQPARWCEVHHIDWWDRDHGETSIDNGILLCSYHHHEVHRHNLTIDREPGGTRDVRVSRTGATAGLPRDMTSAETTGARTLSQAVSTPGLAFSRRSFPGTQPDAKNPRRGDTQPYDVAQQRRGA
ncbi:HNH endonuclease signature motif containing protein [Sanguibacter suarezii]|uniref:HNH endonuclease signature motif containing protein n=1 Tax=Sanguibacter suarezii TaxID=60921 RepID=UPI000830B118|nr:HNH endonuclease signature motif containing protein [Sanguibacter suarezii]